MATDDKGGGNVLIKNCNFDDVIVDQPLRQCVGGVKMFLKCLQFVFICTSEFVKSLTQGIYIHVWSWFRYVFQSRTVNVAKYIMNNKPYLNDVL